MKFPSVIAYVDPATREAIRTAAFEERMSMSEWAGCVLRMAVTSRQEHQWREKRKITNRKRK